METQWELPLIINETSKSKYYSISPIKQASSQVSSHNDPSAFTHHRKKQHKPHFSQFHLNSNSLSESLYRGERRKPQALNCRRNETKVHRSQVVAHGHKPTQNMLVESAFQQLQSFLGRYFKERSSEELQSQKQKLRKIMKNISRPARSVFKINNDRDVIFLDQPINVLFHELKAETASAENDLEAALYHFARAQYYSLSQNLILFGVYCLTEQASIQRQKAQLQLELQGLKKALSLSIQAERTDITATILQKIGVAYYYHGNTVMGEYFHLFSERGLSNKESELYSRSVQLPRYLLALKQKLFGISQIAGVEEEEWKCREADLNTLNNEMQSQAINNQHFRNLEIVSEMLKDNRSRLVGQKLQAQMLHTMSVARIQPFRQTAAKNESQSKELPLINVSRVLKSHLSLNRQKNSHSRRQWQLSRLQQMITS